jgi:hypothetical protein
MRSPPLFHVTSGEREGVKARCRPYVDAVENSPGRDSLGALAVLPGRYGVIAMNQGVFPTAMGLPAVLVAVRIGVTVPELSLAT